MGKRAYVRAWPDTGIDSSVGREKAVEEKLEEVGSGTFVCKQGEGTKKKKKRKSKCEQITGKDLIESKIIALHYGSDNEGLFCRRETMITGD